MPRRQGVVLLLFSLLCACPDSCLHQAPPRGSTQGVEFKPVVQAQGPLSSKTPPKPQRAGKGVFGEEIEYLGYDVEPSAPRASVPVVVTYYFHAAKDVSRDWEIFVHIDDKGGAERINGDHYPVSGKLHTNQWKAGDYVADRFTFTPAAGQAKGAVDLWMGFYEGEERLPISDPKECVNDGNNRLLSGTLQLQ